MKTSIFLTTTLLTLATAHPSTSQPQKRTVDPRSIEILKHIAPDSTSCTGVTTNTAECATAADAAQPLIDSFAKYGVTTPGEQAALLSWMAYESGEFRYDRNHFPAPGRPGQGTRCMFMPEFVGAYAATLSISNSDPAGLLDDVIKAGADWGAASWYYTTKCSDSIKEGVKAGTKAGWQAFVTECVQTTLDMGEKSREVYWTRAAQALGLTV